MISTTYCAGLCGLEGFLITVECNAGADIPALNIIGLPDMAVRESRERMKAAAVNSGFAFPDLSLLINLAPADRQKEGSAIELAMVTAILQCGGIIPHETDLSRKCFIGELSLSGEVRPVRGVLSMVLSALEAGKTEIFVPAGNASEAAAVQGVTVYAVESLRELVAHLTGRAPIQPVKPLEADFETIPQELDFRDVRGQRFARRALEIAAAGNHNVLLIGSPGSGKSMLAKRMPSILPSLTFNEAVETTRIHSVAGILNGEGLVQIRPFRSPHTSMSVASLVGGGKVPAPGEVALAHNGVLFLDELPEFNRGVTESLRQPLEDGCVTITRAAGRYTFPCRFILVCAMNPCPCGYYGSRVRQCTCSAEQIKKYLQKISGPLLDRIDMHVEVPALTFNEMSTREDSEDSAAIRERVSRAREFAAKRQEVPNAHLTPRQTREYCVLDSEGAELLKGAIEKLGLSARAYDRILRVSRTIADLSGSEAILVNHVAEAVQMRALDRKYWH